MRVLKFSLLVFVSLFLSTVFAYTEKIIQLHIPHNQSQFSIQLHSNPSTGYRWQLCKDTDTKKVTLVSHAYHPPTSTTSKLMGAPGFEQWVFKKASADTLSPEKIELCFVYVRPWEPRPVKKIVFEVVLGS